VPQLPPPTDQARIPLTTLYPMPREDYFSLDRVRQALPLGSGRSVLINLWSATCAPCLVELKEFAEREKEIRAAGIEIVALSVDLAGNPAADQADAQRVISTLARLSSRESGSGQAFPFKAGFASEQLVRLLQTLHDHIIWLDTPLPLPSSFLVDASGRLTVIYKGPVAVERLVADAQHGSDSPQQQRRRAAFLPGRLLEDKILADADRRHQFLAYLRMARKLTDSPWALSKAEQYRQALQINPDDALSHNNLGNDVARQGRLQEALEHYQEAIRVDPDYAKAHYNTAVMMERLGRSEQALTGYREAVRLDPDFYEAHNYLGVILVGRGELEEATAHFEKALEIKPDYAEAHNNVGAIQEHMGRIEEAVASYREAVRANPDYAHARDNLARILKELERRQAEAQDGEANE